MSKDIESIERSPHGDPHSDPPMLKCTSHPEDGATEVQTPNKGLHAVKRREPQNQSLACLYIAYNGLLQALFYESIV